MMAWHREPTTGCGPYWHGDATAIASAMSQEAGALYPEIAG